MKQEPRFAVPRDEQARRIIADCLRQLRAIGEEQLASEIALVAANRIGWSGHA